ncbi:MAG: sensor histidine kinase [Candidatus Contendobacter sp.]|nr:sensor histidine kinase [Candidatus Contendobacter sp.]
MTSLQTRLSAGLIVVLAMLTVLAVVIGGYSLRQLAEDFVASRVEHDIETLLAALEFDAAGHPQLAADRINATFRQPYSGHYYRIESAGVELYSRSLWDAELPLPPFATDRFTRTFANGPQGQHLLLVGRAFQVQGRPVTLLATEDFSPVSAGLRRLLLQFGLIALILFGGLLLIQRLIVRRCLAPLDQIRRELARLARGEIPQLPVVAPDEVRPLVTELNRLLELLGQRQQRARHALGNLAHALKTPLTALTQLTEQPPPLGTADLWRQELSQQTQQIRSLIEREMKRARIVGGGNPGQRVLLNQEVADLIATLRLIHRGGNLRIEARIPPDSLFAGDRDDLLELLGNLLNNACEWAATTARLTVDAEREQVRLLVEDDGPGCPPEQLELLRQRGARIDESRTGYGLGLAIAADIVSQYGGVLRLGRSKDLGGFLAEATMPHPPDG